MVARSKTGRKTPVFASVSRAGRDLPEHSSPSFKAIYTSSITQGRLSNQRLPDHSPSQDVGEGSGDFGRSMGLDIQSL